MEETAVDVARSRGQLHKTIPSSAFEDEEEESEPPGPGVRVKDPRHLQRTTAKLPPVKVREDSRKISVREAKELTRRIIERIKAENR